MNFRVIGDTGIKCSIIGLGTGRLASVSGGVSRGAADRLIGAAADCGINLIDTADSYGQGECEKIIGRVLRGKRDKFIVTTKAGYSFSSLGGGLRFLKPMAKGVLKLFKGGRNLAGSVRASVSRQDFRPEAIQKSIESSLLRLQTDYLDIFLLHSPTVAAMEDAQLFEMLRRLKQAGKIRNFGVSSHDPGVLERASKLPGLSVAQTPVNQLHSDSLGMLPKLQGAKIAVIANQIFISGKLFGAQPGAEAEAKQISDAKTRLSALAAKKGISLNQLLIKSALGQPGVVSVLTGTTNPAHLKENVADALSTASLSPEDVASIA